jgi:hypothetical protein
MRLFKVRVRLKIIGLGLGLEGIYFVYLESF